MKNIQRLFEQGRADGLFTDYDFCTMTRDGRSLHCSDGQFTQQGAQYFDIASLTKAVVHLLFVKLFSQGTFSPEDLFSKYMNVPGVGERKLWHFLSYVVQGYAFDYEALKSGANRSFKDALLYSGFNHWGQSFKYDNLSSAYLGLLLESYFGQDLETVLLSNLHNGTLLQSNKLLFHPVASNRVDPSLCVPTKVNRGSRGVVHDPLSFSHMHEKIAVAGIFTDARTLCSLFHYEVASLVSRGYYSTVSRDWLVENGITANSYSLGFDRPFSDSIAGLNVLEPVIFAGWTGCRIFFSPEITICYLTNRVYAADTAESRKEFSRFAWSVNRATCKELLV